MGQVSEAGDKLAAPATGRCRAYHHGMTTYFVSRHPGAIAWAQEQELAIDAFVPHLDTACIAPGDIVMGSLPVNLAAQVCAAGGRYVHLSLTVTPQQRGRELTAAQLAAAGAQLKPYRIEELPESPL